MKTLTEIVIAVGRVERTELLRWVELGWVVPGRSPNGEAEFWFSDVDEARIRMICDLRPRHGGRGGHDAVGAVPARSDVCASPPDERSDIGRSTTA